jgi:hypothetical protein
LKLDGFRLYECNKCSKNEWINLSKCFHCHEFKLNECLCTKSHSLHTHTHFHTHIKNEKYFHSHVDIKKYLHWNFFCINKLLVLKNYLYWKITCMLKIFLCWKNTCWKIAYVKRNACIGKLHYIQSYFGYNESWHIRSFPLFYNLNQKLWCNFFCVLAYTNYLYWLQNIMNTNTKCSNGFSIN